MFDLNKFVKRKSFTMHRAIIANFTRDTSRNQRNKMT